MVSTMRIPYNNVAGQHSVLKAEILEAVAQVIDHGYFILGKEVTQFEEKFSLLCGSKFSIGLNSGTDALILALRAFNIGAGDEVITATNSFVSSASCVALVGARPVLADVRGDFNIDPEQLEPLITSRTKAIIPVHLTGHPADMDPILAIAKKHNLYVIEDAAQAILAEYKGKPVGSFGDAGCFSLHPLKTLNACGDGGVLSTGNKEIFEQVKLLRNIGLINKNECVLWSGNSRLDTMQAAILLVKMKYLEQWTEKRRANARFYQETLKDVPQVQVPFDTPDTKSVYHTFIIQADRRDELKEFLASQGIGTAVKYPYPIHLQPVGRQLGYGPGCFPVAEKQAERILSLPIYPELSESDLQFVASSIRSFYEV